MSAKNVTYPKKSEDIVNKTIKQELLDVIRDCYIKSISVSRRNGSIVFINSNSKITAVPKDFRVRITPVIGKYIADKDVLDAMKSNLKK